MTVIRDTIQRDIGVKVEGVVKVFDRAALATEIREYVVTDKIESELKRIVDTFTHVSDTLRRGGPARDVMGIWISGFFGSGKSHFAKVLGHLLQNTPLDGASGEGTIDAFAKHLSDGPRGRDIRLRLAEIKLNTQIRTIAFEINSRQSLTKPSTVGEILLSELYRHTGFAESFVVARLERRLQQRGLLEDLAAEYERSFGVPWASPEGRDDLLTVRRRLTQVLPRIAPTEYPDERTAKQALDDLFRHERLTAEGIADELTAWVDARKTAGKAAHLVFVVDEVGTFIGDSNERISELNSLAEMIGNKGKGKVWLIATSQQDLEKVVDRTNFQPALVGRLNARFELKPHLISDEIGKVVSERILKKKPAEEEELRRLYRENEGPIAQLADLKANRRLGHLDERAFVETYPFLPHQIILAQEIFEGVAGFRLSGGVRSMISVVMEVLQEMADRELGALVSFDQIFDAVENDLLSQAFLGASGVRDIHESNQRVIDTPVAPARVLKVLWLLQHAPWVPRVSETLAKLLASSVSAEIPPLRKDVEKTLDALRDAGYVARDEATGEWKVLNEQERTIEQVIQEMVRSGGPRSISMAAVRRTSQQLCKEELITSKRLGNFAVIHGVSQVPFYYGARLDGEAIETGPEIEVQFLSPLAPGRKQEIEEIRQRNQAAGPKGRILWWVADAPEPLQARLARFEALVKVTSDKRFVEDTSEETKKALAEKRKERDDLRGALLRDLEKAFLKGTLFYGGRETDLQGEAGDLREVLAGPVENLILKVYPRFPLADRKIDFARQLKALLNPNSATSALHAVAPELELFDTQGSLQRDTPLVSTVLEVLRDLADEGVEPTGALLLDARDRKGFQGLGRSPFGWPDEIVRLTLAACLRAGAVYLEQPTATGPVRVYEYRGSDDSFAKINTFRKLVFHGAETALSVDQIKQASRALIALGVKGVPESGTALAAAVRDLGLELRSRLEEARLRQQQGLPIPDEVLGAESALIEAVTVRDPTQAVLAFLVEQDRWKALHDGIEALRTFLDANRHLDFEASRRLEELAATHPVPGSHPRAAELSQARRDMAALIANGEVLRRWPDYRAAFDRAFEAYRDAYLEAYKRLRSAAESNAAAIRAGARYLAAPADQREAVVAQVFGEGRVCHYPPLTLPAVRSLLEAAGRRSLSSLAEALIALPGYRAQVEAELRELSAPPSAASEEVYEWHSPHLLSRRFRTESEVDQALQEVSEELAEIKKRVRGGVTVVVK
ncbi:MAG TPA: BREX system P-loop protein BrxC [Thermoanaerobaculia bacterium]|jgi:hypothetical protein